MRHAREERQREEEEMERGRKRKVRERKAGNLLVEAADIIEATHKIMSSFVQDRQTQRGMTWEKYADICKSLPGLVKFYSNIYHNLVSGISSANDLFDVATVAKDFAVAFRKFVQDMKPILRVIAAYTYEEVWEDDYKWLLDDFSVGYGDKLVCYFTGDPNREYGAYYRDWCEAESAKMVLSYYGDIEKCLWKCDGAVQDKLVENLK